ncbi:MAG TPA: hypothetical protein VF590_07880, partial [Isosphaeraceae bacterium]
MLAGAVVVLFGTFSPAAPSEPRGADAPIRMTVEVTWELASPPGLPGPPAPPATLEVPGGRILEAQGGVEEGSEDPTPTAVESRRVLGSERSGRVRARIEAPTGASLVVRAGGQAVQFPLLSVLEGPQRTAPQVPLGVEVERLGWDPLEVRLDDGDGTAPPGAVVPVTVGFNVLTPEPTDVALRFSAELRPLRGGEALWRADRSEVIPTNTWPAPARLLAVPMPRAEGTYVLEVQSSWEPVANLEGTRLGRWWRRKHAGGSVNAARRRVALAVIGPR